MGIDIFMYAEIKENGLWKYYGDFEIDRESEDSNLKPVEIYYTGVNSCLYAILANYRNFGMEDGFGKKELPYNYISKPRGFPIDLSPEIRKWAEIFEEDLEYPSWLLLKEIIDFDWNQTIIKRRMIHREYAYLFNDENKSFPKEKGPDGERISYANYCSDGVFVSWTESYAESVGKGFMDFLNEIGEKFEKDKLRFVFWFC